MARVEALGFGFVPSESAHHFVVHIPRGEDGEVTIDERFTYGEPGDAAQVPTADQREPRRKVVLSLHKWTRIEGEVRAEFNRRLRQARQKPGSWKAGENLAAAHFGKELVLLAWAIEDADPSLIPIAYANWDGLVPEERWWLYTTINATSGHPEHGRDRGWRKAIRIAFTENPVGDRPFRQYDDLIDPDTGTAPFGKGRRSRRRKPDAPDADPDQLSLL
jgi:hypothetical protein